MSNLCCRYRKPVADSVRKAARFGGVEVKRGERLDDYGIAREERGMIMALLDYGVSGFGFREKGEG